VCWRSELRCVYWLLCCEGVKYNEEKERKAKWDGKQKELARIEEAKKREAEKGLYHFY